MPPRTQNSPCSSTGSSGEKPATTSRSPRSRGAISCPGASDRPAAANRRGIGQARQQRARRRDDQPGGAGGEAVQRAGARRRDLEVRQQAAVRIDFLRRKRHARPARRPRSVRPSTFAEEEPGVGDQLLDVGVGRAPRAARGRPRRRSPHGTPRPPATGRSADGRGAMQPGRGRRRFQQRAQRQ